jgi:hypothetical protein
MLSFHLQKHSYSRLIWFFDLAMLLRKYAESIEWKEVIHRAESFRLEKSLYITLAYLAHIFQFHCAIKGLEAFPPHQI